MRSYDRKTIDERKKKNIMNNIYNRGGAQMGDSANTTDIINFLEMAKRLISVGKYDFVPRRKNMQSLARHGLTIMDAKGELINLVVGDYYKGPKRDFDTDRPGGIWEFKKNIDGTKFYVKMKIVQENGDDILKCIGFHDDDFAQIRGDDINEEVL